ncbi:metalloregulator ArsR/SmtB family transcription factor [Cryobacterium sp. Y57]|uniref:ArsR/SmtB family transcription factor n=1 Tax=Cryobacterium sp. Y57 TaxID=2048287 RepID=UPI000CE52E50
MPPDPGPMPDENLVEVFKALGNPIRLRILRWLKNPEVDFADYEPIADRAEVGVCVSHIQAKAGLAQSTVSAYMAILERAGLVRSTRIGKWTHYRRDESQIEKLVISLGRNL